MFRSDTQEVVGNYVDQDKYHKANVEVAKDGIAWIRSLHHGQNDVEEGMRQSKYNDSRKDNKKRSQ